MKKYHMTVVLLAGLVFLGMLSVVKAQSPTNTFEWESLRPEGEEFTVQMPKGSTFESNKEQYHKMALNSRVYLSKTQGGPVFAVVSLSGIKSNPAMYSEMQRVNSYVDAFKDVFPPKLGPVAAKPATAPAPVKLTIIGEKSLQGHAGREYKMSIGALAGTVQVFATRKRFYAMVYLNSKKDDALQEEFVSSFTLPEKAESPMPAVAESQPTTPPNGPRQSKVQSDDPAGAAAAGAGAEGETKPDAAGAAAQAAKHKPISGGVLNGKAIVLPKPDYPIDARTAGAAGSVAVQVLVDESGMVIEAKAFSGHPLLQQPSVNAALQARFNPTSLMGEPVKVSGVLVFTFAKP